MSSTEIQQQAILSAAQLAKEISPWVSMVISATLIIWAISRARSAHFFFDRVWRLIGGGAVKDTDLIKAWDVVRDIEGFRFKTGINFKTKNTLTKTLKWLDKNEMTITELSFIREWIEDNPLKIKKPQAKKIKAFAWTISAILIPIAIAITYIAVQPNVLLTIKSSGFTFWTDGTVATNNTLNSNSPKFTITEEDCKTEIPGLNKYDKSVICLALSPTSKSKIASSLLEQRIIAAYLIFICLLFILPSVRLSAKAKMAEKFYRLQNP